MIALRVVQGSISIDRLQRALRYILSKHKILRTSLIFNNDDGILEQCITDNHEAFTIADKQIFTNKNELENIIYETTINPNLFDLSNGRVFHCQILRQEKSIDENKDNEFITNCDVLIIAFHHVAFDRSCRLIFYNDLCVAYNDDLAMSANEETLQYIDYTIHERLMDVTSSREFWHSELEGYNFETPLLLPVDLYRSSTDQRSGIASIAEISFNNDISAAFLNYTSSHEVTAFQLGLATFYTFLFKLTYGQNDLFITCLNANRYRTELENMFGMFVTILPYRIELDSQWSFDELVKHVREKCLSILEHSHYPLQHMLIDSQIYQSNVLFLDVVFDFIIISSSIDQLSFGGSSLELVPLERSSEVAKFDFKLTFVYNSTCNDNKLSCRLTCSQDIFDETTVFIVARRFQYLFSQLFSPNSTVSRNDTCFLPVCELSLFLPEETKEIENIAFYRLSNIGNEGMILYSLMIFRYLILKPPCDTTMGL